MVDSHVNTSDTDGRGGWDVFTHMDREKVKVFVKFQQ